MGINYFDLISKEDWDTWIKPSRNRPIIEIETTITPRFKPNLFPELKKIYFNKEKGATCALWSDGSKTVIRLQPGDTWDEEKAIAICYMKRALGNSGRFNDTLKKFCNID